MNTLLLQKQKFNDFCNRPQNTLDSACLWARVPDSRISNRKSPTTICAELAVRDGHMKTAANVGAGGKQHQKLACSVQSDTEELGCAGIST